MFCVSYISRICTYMTLPWALYYCILLGIPFKSRSAYLPCIAWMSINFFTEPILGTIFLVSRFKHGIFGERQTLICGYKLRIANIMLIPWKHFLLSKTSSRRACKTSSRCLQDVFAGHLLQVFKTFCTHVLKASWWRLERQKNIMLKMS